MNSKRNRIIAIIYPIVMGIIVLTGIKLKWEYNDVQFYKSAVRARVVKDEGQFLELDNGMSIGYLGQPFSGSVQIKDSIIKEANTWSFCISRLNRYDNYKFFGKYYYKTDTTFNPLNFH